MHLAAIVQTEAIERRARLIDMRIAMASDQSGIDDAVRKIDAASERIAERLNGVSRG